jgi:molybdopterin synthase catalytic subunit
MCRRVVGQAAIIAHRQVAGDKLARILDWQDSGLGLATLVREPHVAPVFHGIASRGGSGVVDLELIAEQKCRPVAHVREIWGQPVPVEVDLARQVLGKGVPFFGHGGHHARPVPAFLLVLLESDNHGQDLAAPGAELPQAFQGAQDEPLMGDVFDAHAFKQVLQLAVNGPPALGGVFVQGIAKGLGDEIPAQSRVVGQARAGSSSSQAALSSPGSLGGHWGQARYAGDRPLEVGWIISGFPRPEAASGARRDSGAHGHVQLGPIRMDMGMATRLMDSLFTRPQMCIRARAFRASSPKSTIRIDSFLGDQESAVILEHLAEGRIELPDHTVQTATPECTMRDWGTFGPCPERRRRKAWTIPFVFPRYPEWIFHKPRATQKGTRLPCEKVGMVLVHNGVARATSRDGRPVSAIEVIPDFAGNEAIRAEGERLPGISEFLVEARSGNFAPGDDLLFIVVAGDIRENVHAALAWTLDRIKSEAVTKREAFVSS